MKNSEEWQEWIAFAQDLARGGWSAREVLDMLEERRKRQAEFAAWKAEQKGGSW